MRKPFDGSFNMSQDFGVPHQRYTAMGLAGHNGVDFALPPETPIYASFSGECWEAGPSPTWGNHVKIRDELGGDWIYAHMEPWELPRPGTWVSEGMIVGYSNNTGLSTGPHLHFGYRPRWWVRGWPYDGYERPPALALGES